MQDQNQSKKYTVLSRLYSLCRERGDFSFDNNDVRTVCNEVGFSNLFDATKIDNSSGLPDVLRANDMFLVHLGRQGREATRHRFVKGITVGYHEFEDVPDEWEYHWRYRRSILNNINTSESNILSVGYNQRIIHDFLYEDITASPKVYGSNRTQIDLIYRIGSDNISANRVQIEIDLTLEYLNQITVFEAKNGMPSDFNVFQLFNPFHYYLQATSDVKEATVKCCYLLRDGDRLRLYLYSFGDPLDPSSIVLERNAQYTLVAR